MKSSDHSIAASARILRECANRIRCRARLQTNHWTPAFQLVCRFDRWSHKSSARGAAQRGMGHCVEQAQGIWSRLGRLRQSATGCDSRASRPATRSRPAGRGVGRRSAIFPFSGPALWSARLKYVIKTTFMAPGRDGRWQLPMHVMRATWATTFCRILGASKAKMGRTTRPCAASGASPGRWAAMPSRSSGRM